MKKPPMEHRYASAPVHVRANTDGRTPPVISGYAAVFNIEAVINGLFRERIAPGAFRMVIGATADVRGLFNHDDNIVLGRTTNGTLRLSEDARGLRYEIDPNPEDRDAVSVVAKIKRGDVNQSSYSFRVKEGGDQWTQPRRAGELPLRTITEFELLRDISPVTFPAFEETTAEARRAAALSRQGRLIHRYYTGALAITRARVDILGLE
jgi:HK97 family phage prohead protease